MATGTPALITYAEAAHLLSVSVRTVRRLVRDGRLGVVRLGHRTARLKRSEITSLIKAGGGR